MFNENSYFDFNNILMLSCIINNFSCLCNKINKLDIIKNDNEVSFYKGAKLLTIIDNIEIIF